MEEDVDDEGEEIDDAQGPEDNHRRDGHFLVDLGRHVVGEGVVGELVREEDLAVDEVPKDEATAVVGKAQEAIDLGPDAIDEAPSTRPS